MSPFTSVSEPDGAGKMRHWRGYAAAPALGRWTDHIAAGEAVVACLAPDPGAIWANAMDSRRIESGHGRADSSQERQRTARAAISSSDHGPVHRTGELGVGSAACSGDFKPQAGKGLGLGHGGVFLHVQQQKYHCRTL